MGFLVEHNHALAPNDLQIDKEFLVLGQAKK